MAQFNNMIISIRQYLQHSFTAFAVFCHLLFAAIVFSPYFLYNYVLLANTDIPDFNIPMFILAKRGIFEGHFNFWNPYLLNGVSTLLSAVVPIYGVINPATWPLFLVPEKYLLLAGTFQSFVNLWLIGIVAYLFFFEELNSKKWAFFSATIYQMSGYSLWWIWTFELSSMWLWFTLALYLIWTAYKRSAYLNYLLLTLTLFLLLVPSYPIASANILIILGIMALYRYLAHFKTHSRWHHLLTSMSALVTSSLVFTIRLLPAWYEANLTSRAQSFSLDFRDLSFLGLRLFNPELLGIDNIASYRLLGATRFGEGFDSEFHIHGYFPQFFGVLVALLLLWAVISFRKERASVIFWFWLGYVGVSFAIIAGIEPVDSLFRILVFPIHRPIGVQVFLPIGVCMLAGLMGKHLEESDPQALITPRSLVLLGCALIFVLVYMITVWLLQYPDLISLARLVIIVTVIVAISIWWLYHQWPAKVIGALSFLSYLAVIVVSGFSLYYIFWVTEPNQTFLSHLKIISSSLLLLLLVYLGIRAKSKEFSTLRIYGAGLAILLIISFFLGVVFYPQTEVFRELLAPQQTLQLAILGGLRFIIVGLTFIVILQQLRQGKFRQKWLFSVFFMLIIFDLLPAGKIHSYLLSTPFYKDSVLFPTNRLDILTTENGSPLELDTKNYRVNRPSAMLKLPYGLELYGQGTYLMTGFSVYGVRAYDGYYNGVPNRYRKFVANWSAPEVAAYSHGIYAFTNERFLDLSGVRYDYDTNSRTVHIRPLALSRFMLFNIYETISDDKKTLERLTDADFYPLREVLLDGDPGIPPSQSTRWAKKLDFTEHSTDVIELDVISESAGIVFFNDNYHPDWKAYVNGQEQPIFHANYNFMAIAVPAGESKVVFRYQPRFLYYGAYMAGMGLLLFLIITLTLYAKRKRIDASPSMGIAHQVPFQQRILANFRTFRLAYLSFILLLFLAIAQAVFNYHEPDSYYKGYYIVNKQDAYYALPYTMWPMDIKNTRDLGPCYQDGECVITNSLEEAREFIDRPVEQRRPALVEEGYRGFNVLFYQNEYYAVPQSPWMFNLLDKKALSRCQADGQCGRASSLDEVKQQVASLSPLKENKLSDLIESITTPTPHPILNGERLFDWHSDQWSEFPQWIDITFRQPVELKWLGFQVQVDKGRSVPQQVLLLAGEDFEDPDYLAPLLLNEDRADDWIFGEPPDFRGKYRHYRIFMGTQSGEYPDWLTIEDTQLFILVEEDFDGFNIYWDQSEYYVVAQDLEPVDILNIHKLDECRQGDRCNVAPSLKEAKQLVGELTNQTP